MTTTAIHDTNGLVFGGANGAPGTTDLIIDVERDKDITVLTLGRAALTGGPEAVPVETIGEVRLTPDEVDLLVHWIIGKSAGQRHRVDNDLWTHMLDTRRRVFEQGGEPAAVDDAWAQHQIRMRQLEPSHPDDIPGMKLWVDAYSGNPAAKETYDRYLADRAVRCRDAVRRVLAVAGPLTFREIIEHPEWCPVGISQNDWGLAASLTQVLRAGVAEGWLERRVRGSESRWTLTDIV